MCEICLASLPDRQHMRVSVAHVMTNLACSAGLTEYAYRPCSFRP